MPGSVRAGVRLGLALSLFGCITLLIGCSAGADAWAAKAQKTYEAQGWELVATTVARTSDSLFAAAPVRLAFMHPTAVTRVSANVVMVRILYVDRTAEPAVEIFTNVVDCASSRIAFVAEGVSPTVKPPSSPNWRVHAPGEPGAAQIAWACKK